MKRGETDQSKLAWLKQHNVTKKKVLSHATINRLYSFYQRNPLDTPVYLAYGMRKRLDENVKIYGEDYELSTPRGKFTAKKYVTQTVKRRASFVQKKLSYRASFTHSKYKKYMHRVQDYLFYHPRVTANEATYERTLKQLQLSLLPTVQEDVDLVAQNFQIFYKTALVGSVATFKSNDFPQGEGYNYQRVGFVRLYGHRYKEYLDFFIEELFESLKQGFALVFKYENMSVTLVKLEIIFTSDKRASLYEKLRV